MAHDFHMQQLFQESNFEAADRDRYPAVLEAGVTQNGISTDDVLAVAHDLRSGLWAICTTGVFRADLRGMFKKRIEVDDLIPYLQVVSVGMEPSGPHTQKVVIYGSGGRKLAQINFSAAGPARTIEGAAAHCARIQQIAEGARRQAQ
ncbi:MAG: hypothetical protein WB507_03770 [Solirubrobacterales bacterium]